MLAAPPKVGKHPNSDPIIPNQPTQSIGARWFPSETGRQDASAVAAQVSPAVESASPRPLAPRLAPPDPEFTALLGPTSDGFPCL